MRADNYFLKSGCKGKEKDGEIWRGATYGSGKILLIYVVSWNRRELIKFLC